MRLSGRWLITENLRRIIAGVYVNCIFAWICDTNFTKYQKPWNTNDNKCPIRVGGNCPGLFSNTKNLNIMLGVVWVTWMLGWICDFNYSKYQWHKIQITTYGPLKWYKSCQHAGWEHKTQGEFLLWCAYGELLSESVISNSQRTNATTYKKQQMRHMKCCDLSERWLRSENSRRIITVVLIAFLGESVISISKYTNITRFNCQNIPSRCGWRWWDTDWGHNTRGTIFVVVWIYDINIGIQMTQDTSGKIYSIKSGWRWWDVGWAHKTQEDFLMWCRYDGFLARSVIQLYKLSITQITNINKFPTRNNGK